MMKVLGLLAMIILFSGCSDSIEPSISGFKLLTPRPYGYVTGDEIIHRIEFETRNAVILQPGSLPAQGVINRWLNVNKVTLKQVAVDSGFFYRIELRYQVFYAPQEVKMLTIPGFKLNLKQGENSTEQAVPAWHFTLSPLRELAVRKDDNGEYMRPDAPPQRLSPEQPRQWLVVSGLAALFSALTLGYLAGYFPGLSGPAIFKRAARQMAGLSEHDMGQVLTILHQAFNSLYKKPLFQHQLEDFFQQHSAYRSLAQQFEWFFDYSNQYFFAGDVQVDPTHIQKLKQLCRECRLIERGGL